ncbi:hypothetical protein A8H39_20575 [Paraburkholderia fungorum]|jgi:hypothetical protein|uniref:hypothetical protein n=1 Tax=Paraburkholderia fungorum TaxID=134537 RepID=UPI000485827D|nr:hypothetical protein [Paraburkholderia fungorum]MBB5546341.1 hypothetical protein [Paraburkholderia fungorum]PNE57996.1 hypothetical protein A8H39_20575 [Paraburkholderia fungorum]
MNDLTKLLGLSKADALIVLQAEPEVERWEREHGEKLEPGQVPFEGSVNDPRTKSEIAESRRVRDLAWLKERGF